MKKRHDLFPLLLSLAALLVGTALFPTSSLAAPAVGKPVPSLATIPVGQTTQLTIISQITDDATNPVLSTGVNLLRLDASNKVIATLGTMRDDGTNGDAVAGDKIFTLRLMVTELALGEMRLQVSAAFKGLLKRVLSGVTAVPIVTSAPAPASMQLSLSQSVVNGGESLSFLVVFFDAGGEEIVPAPQANCGITSRPGETSGTPPTLAGQTINTSNDTRGTFQVTCSLSATALSATQQFVIIRSTGGGPSQAGLYGNFSKRLTDAFDAMDQLVQALANGQLGAIPGLRNDLIAARDGVDLVAMQRSTPFAPEGGFPPTPDELTAKGFPPIPDDATLKTVLTALITKWEESTAFTNSLNPLSFTNADIARLDTLNTELETLVAQLASLTPSVNGVVATSSHFHQLLAITLPTSLYALVNKVDEALRLNGLALNFRTPMDMYAAMLGGVAGSVRSARITQAEYYSQIRPAQSLSELFAGMRALGSVMSATYRGAFPALLIAMGILRDRALLEPFRNNARLRGIITNFEFSFDLFHVPCTDIDRNLCSIIEGSVIDPPSSRPYPGSYDVFLVGPVEVVLDFLQSSVLCLNPIDLEEVWSCFENVKTLIEAAGELFTEAHQTPDHVVADSCILPQNSPEVTPCNRLTYDRGFRSVYHCSGFFCLPRPVLVVVHRLWDGYWASDVVSFAPTP